MGDAACSRGPTALHPSYHGHGAASRKWILATKLEAAVTTFGAVDGYPTLRFVAYRGFLGVLELAVGITSGKFADSDQVLVTTSFTIFFFKTHT
jgi:hypothetical protein